MIEMEGFRQDLAEVRRMLAEAGESLQIDHLREQLAEYQEDMGSTGFWDDTAHAQAVSKKAGNLRETIREYDEAASLLSDAQAAFELSSEDEAFAQEASDAIERLSAMLDSLEVSSWFTGSFDDGDAILTVNPGQGGLEANDWADMLFKLYTHYAESKG